MRCRSIFSIALYLAVLMLLCTSAASGEIKLVTQREGHKLSAASEPLVRCAMEFVNRPFSITKMPWERAQRNVKDGILDGFFIATKNSKRDSYAVISDPLFTVKWLYVVRKDGGIHPDNANFNTLQFCADIGSARLKWLEGQHKKGEIKREIMSVDTPGQMIRLLTARRIDVALMNEHGLQTSLASLAMDMGDIETFIVREIPAGLYFSKQFLTNNPGFLDEFNAGLIRCKKLEKRTYTLYTGTGSPMKNIIEELLMEAFKRIGLNSELVQVASAQRALVLANQEGDGDAMRVNNIKEIAPETTGNLLQVPEPIVFIKFFVFSKSLSFPVDNWTSLKGYRNGARVGVKILEENMPEQSLFLPTTDRLFQMLDAGRLDTVVEWELNAIKTLQDHDMTGIKQLHPSIVSVPGHVYVHQKHKNIIPSLSAALAEMKADGTYEKIKRQIAEQFFGQ